MRRALEMVVVAVLVTWAVWANAQEVEGGAELTDRAAAQQKMISLNLSGEVDLPVFLDYVSKATGKSFVYDQGTFSGKVMLLAPTKIPESNLFILLESLLEYQDYALVPGTGGVIKVVKKTETAARPTPVVLADELDGLPDSDSMLTVAYKLKYVNTPEIQTAIGPLVGASKATIVVIARANVILLTDYLSNLRRMVRIIGMIDDERNAPKVEIFDLKYASAESLARQLAMIVAAQAAMGAAGREQQLTKLEYDTMTNRIIVVSTTAGIEAMAELINKLDVEPSDSASTRRFYKLKNTKAKDIAETLQQLAQQTPSGVRSIPGAGARGPAGAGGSGGLISLGDLKIIGDENSNTVIVFGPADAQAEIEALIKELDKRKAQVVIRALVVQVSGGDNSDVGVELASWGGDGIGVSAFGFSTYDYATGVRTIKEDLGVTGAVVNDGEIPMLLRALLVEDSGKIISRPWLLANDNKEATFKSLDEQPTTQVNALTSSTSTTSFQGYQPAGTTLTITPQISEGGYLTLDIALEISQFTGTSEDAAVPPPKRTDSLTSTVTVPDRSTIVIGGLSGYHVTETIKQVPILGKIPIIGALFRRTIRTRDDATEYIFIKAQIAKDEGFEDLLGISKEAEDKAAELEARKAGEVVSERLNSGGK